MRLAQINEIKNSEQQSDVDITPMLDVIFILLIFFIVTASFIEESGVSVSKPNSIKSENPSESIVVRVLDAGQVSVQGAILDHRSVRPAVTRLLAESPDSSVAVQVEKRAKTESLIKVVDALESANVILPPISLIDS